MSKPLLKSKNFELVVRKGVGINDTPWTMLEVISKDIARKHVVSIDLEQNHEDFVGKPVQYKYYDVRVDHGMRSALDTLDETVEYIEVLKEAVDFAKKIMKWIAANPEWKA